MDGMDTSRPQHSLRTFRLVHVSSSFNDTAITYDGETDRRRMAAHNRFLARVREEDKTVNEGHHVPANRATADSLSRRDDNRCHPLASVMDYLPLPCTPLPAGNSRGRRYNADLKRARLEADSPTSSGIGKDALLQVMKKIDMMGLDDIDKLKSG